jgi:hypothetical protein
VAKWSLSGDQGNTWLNASVALFSASFRFQYVRGGGYAGDAAVAQVAVSCGVAPRRRMQAASTTMWSVVSGSSYCQITHGGTCVTDGEGDYDNNERCTVRAEVALLASAQGGFSTVVF